MRRGGSLEAIKYVSALRRDEAGWGLYSPMASSGDTNSPMDILGEVGTAVLAYHVNTVVVYL